jgi:hypothetical protein
MDTSMEHPGLRSEAGVVGLLYASLGGIIGEVPALQADAVAP